MPPLTPPSTGVFFCPEHGAIDQSLCRVCHTSEITLANYMEARTAGNYDYEGFCTAHDWTKFFTKTARCATCFTIRGRKRREQTPRALARDYGDTSYADQCETHGRTLFSVQHGKCLKCCTTAGVRRAAAELTPRIEARRLGDRWYNAICVVHGETPHAVVHGKCLKCFTMGGAARVEPHKAWET